MVNEYASSSEYGGGPSPGYSGAGGGEPGSAYTTNPLDMASVAAASVTGYVIDGQRVNYTGTAADWPAYVASVRAANAANAINQSQYNRSVQEQLAWERSRQPGEQRVGQLPTQVEKKQGVVEPKKWGTGEQYRGILPEATIAQINAALFIGKAAAESFFKTQTTGLPQGIYSTGEISRINPTTGSPFINAPVAKQDIIGAIVNAPEALYELAGGLQEGISGVTKAVYDVPIPSLPEAQGMPFQVPGVTSASPRTLVNTAIGGISTLASTVPFVLSIPYGAKFAVTQPAAVPGKAYEIVANMLGDIAKSEVAHPGSAIGIVGGMYVGGKTVGALAGKVEAFSPINLDINVKIPTGLASEYNVYHTASVKNPFAAIPEPRFVGGIAYGADIKGVSAFKGSPIEVMKGTTIGVSDLFNVRDISVTPSPAQMRLIDPFFRAVTKGTENEPIVSAFLDLKKAIPASETSLDYSITFREGSFQQTGISAATQAKVQETLSQFGGVRLGSSATTEMFGREHVRPTLKSDIDVDIPESQFAHAVEQLKTIYAENPTPVEFKGGGLFALKGAGPEEHLISASFIEKHPDVRSVSITTPDGITKLQTPEFGIESKAARIFGTPMSNIQYSPKGGARVYLVGSKLASDIADIYAGSRGIASVAYTQGKYDLGRIYESISDNIKKYGEQTGQGEKISSIPKDILAGVRREPVIEPNIFGINTKAYTGITMGRRYPGDEYYTEYAAKKIEAPYRPYIPIKPNPYPTGAPFIPLNPLAFEYPQYVPQPEKIPIAPSGGKYPAYIPTPSTGGLASGYPTGTVIPQKVYPVPFVTPFKPPAPVQPSPARQNIITTTPRWFLLPKVYPLKKEEQKPYRVKTRRQKGKRFAEVFSFDVFRGMKVPGRLYIKNFESTAGGKPKRFEEVFSLSNPPLPKVRNVPLPGKKLRRMKTRKP